MNFISGIEKELVVAAGVVFSVLAPIHTTMLVVCLIIMGDFFTGICAAYKTKTPITSARMRDSITKLFFYNVAIISCYGLEQFLIGDAFPAVKLCAGLIGSTEVLSILENINIITDSKVFDSLIAKLGSPNKKD